MKQQYLFRGTLYQEEKLPRMLDVVQQLPVEQFFDRDGFFDETTAMTTDSYWDGRLEYQVAQLPEFDLATVYERGKAEDWLNQQAAVIQDQSRFRPPRVEFEIDTFAGGPPGWYVWVVVHPD